jgi:hypothetical protein
MHLFRKLPIAVSASLLLLACSPQSSESEGEASDVPGEATPDSLSSKANRPRSGFDPMFEKAATEFNVPASLLKAIGFVETRW